MKRVDIDRYGAPEDVARCVEVADVGAPDAGEVVFDVLLFPINPADVSFCRGTYRLRPPLPATPGAECVGRVSAVGAGVAHVKPGDLVINLQRENWAQRRRVKADDVIPIPPGIDLQQGAMLRINPPTALLLLSDFVELKPGDWIIQNVANSAVGRLVIRLSLALGVRTMNVVRRASLFDELKTLGADACVVDGPDLADKVNAANGSAPIRLALDAVSGQATARLSGCLAEGGVVVNYGSNNGTLSNATWAATGPLWTVVPSGHASCISAASLRPAAVAVTRPITRVLRTRRTPGWWRRGDGCRRAAG